MILEVERMYPLELYKESILEVINEMRGPSSFGLNTNNWSSNLAYFTTKDIKCVHCGSLVLLPGSGRNFGLCMGCDYLYPSNAALEFEASNSLYIDPISNLQCRLRLYVQSDRAIRDMQDRCRKINSHAEMFLEDNSILAIYVKEAIKRSGDQDKKAYFVV